MTITKIIGCFLLILATSCDHDPYIEISQKNNQKFISEEIKKFYYDRNDLNLNGQVAGILEFKSLADTLRKNISLQSIASPEKLIKFVRQDMVSKNIDFFKFNKSGQAIRRLNYYDHEKHQNHEDLYEYKFNKKGQLVELDEFDFDLKREKYQRFKYDRKGKIIDVTSKSQSDKFINKTQFIYDNEYMIIRYNRDRDSLDFGEHKYKNGYYMEQAEIDLWRNKEYDQQGNIIKYDRPSYTDTFLRNKIEKEFNTNNQLIREIEYGPSNEVIQIETFLYSKDGILLQRVKVEEGETRIWQFNRNKRSINFFSSTHLMDSTHRLTNSFSSYDKFSNKTHETYFSLRADNKFHEENTKIKLDYDSLGNWTKRQVFKNDSLIESNGRIVWYEN